MNYNKEMIKLTVWKLEEVDLQGIVTIMRLESQSMLRRLDTLDEDCLQDMRTTYRSLTDDCIHAQYTLPERAEKDEHGDI